MTPRTEPYLSQETIWRRAIQLGLRGEMLRRFSRWVETQRVHVQSGQLELPSERVFRPQNPRSVKRLGLEEF